jgi:RND superfamily putative drug exporter
VVERVACWSARHRGAAVLAWLALAAAAFVGGRLLGTQSQPQYDPGQSGAAERMFSQLHVVTPPAESVLISSRDRAAGQTFATGARLRQATRQVVAALRARPGAAAGIRSPFGPGGRALISRDGRSALVTFAVAGPHGKADATVAADLAAVASVQASHPGLIVTEAGDAGTDRAANALMSADFRRAEITSVPITLLLVVVFGALIAAGIPVLLAGTGALHSAIRSAAPAARVVALDASAEMLRIARAWRGAHAVIADALALSLADREADAVILAYVRDHHLGLGTWIARRHPVGSGPHRGRRAACPAPSRRCRAGPARGGGCLAAVGRAAPRTHLARATPPSVGPVIVLAADHRLGRQPAPAQPR